MSAPSRRPGAVGVEAAAPAPAKVATLPVRQEVRVARGTGPHALVRTADNERLSAYEFGVKAAFDGIVPTLKKIAALRSETDFPERAQTLAKAAFGFELPADLLQGSWVEGLDMRRLFAFAVFRTYGKFCDSFVGNDPLGDGFEDFDAFLKGCGFHLMDVTPCADGRLAHVIAYVLRLPYRSVRRKSFAGAMFDVEDNIQKWVEVELQRFRDATPETGPDTRYLKVVVYHFSSVDPTHEGCAAHGSDDARAAASGRERLVAFREAVENSFGAGVDTLLIGLDTDTDAIRVHVPNAEGKICLDRAVDALELFTRTTGLDQTRARQEIAAAVRIGSRGGAEGMARLVERLIENNFSQIAYVRQCHGSTYADAGHAERFIGAGIGFEDIQLRNLMYFAYLSTVEEGAADLDVGIKIFTGLNVNRGLPAPVVVRFDYHGHVPGARERAVERCGRVTDGLKRRYAQLWDKGLLHVMQVVRDCTANASLEVLGCTASPEQTMGATP